MTRAVVLRPARWVLDTNVVLDLLHFRDPRALPLLLALGERRATAFVTQAALCELQRVLGYAQFGLDAAAQRAILQRYRVLAVQVEVAPGPPGLPRCSDPDDQKFLELAAAIAADTLVTRDRALLKLARRAGLDLRIATPAETVRGLTR